MILDEVLESKSFNKDAMVDIFVEGFLYALEMQENGQKASSMEELSETLSEAANVAISELSKEDMQKNVELINLSSFNGHLIGPIRGKLTRKMIQKILASDKFKNNKFAKLVKYPTKNKLDEYACKIFMPSILYSLEVDDKDRHDAKKFMDELLKEANKEYKGIINGIEVKVFDTNIDRSKNKVCMIMYIDGKVFEKLFAKKD